MTGLHHCSSSVPLVWPFSHIGQARFQIKDKAKMLVISYHQRVTMACLPPGEVEKNKSIQMYKGMSVVSGNLQKSVKNMSVQKT